VQAEVRQDSFALDPCGKPQIGAGLGFMHCKRHDREEIGISAQVHCRFERQVQAADDSRKPQRHLPATGQPTGNGIVIQAPPCGLTFGGVCGERRVVEASEGVRFLAGQHGIPAEWREAGGGLGGLRKSPAREVGDFSRVGRRALRDIMNTLE
jgi:hypothetical protein